MVKGMGDRMHIIGEGDDPVLILKKKDVPKLFNSQFWNIYELWHYYHNGFGLPSGGHWSEQDPDLMRFIVSMETHFRRHFSYNSVFLKYQEAMLKRLDVMIDGIGKLLRKR